MTKKMPALFAKHPPKKPLTSLSAIVDDWINRFGSNGWEKHRRDLVVEFTGKARGYDQAVWRAVRSKDAFGKHHNHQSRVPALTLDMYGGYLIFHLGGVKIKSFDQLHDICEEVAARVQGIGPVTIYDVATRLAAYYKVEIESLYLHAGVKIGWQILHGHRAPDVKRIPKLQLPKELQRLPADEVEDMLCAYREYLKPWLAK